MSAHSAPRFETRTFLAPDGVELRADVARGATDDAPAVVLLHGGGQTRHSWGTAARTLAARGYGVVNLDSRGHGDSGWSPDGRYSLEVLAARPAPLLHAALAGRAGGRLDGRRRGDGLRRRRPRARGVGAWCWSTWCRAWRWRAPTRSAPSCAPIRTASRRSRMPRTRFPPTTRTGRGRRTSAACARTCAAPGRPAALALGSARHRRSAHGGTADVLGRARRRQPPRADTDAAGARPRKRHRR